MQASLFDSNVWVAVTFTGHSFHLQAKAALLETEPAHPVHVPRAVEQSWLRLITTHAVQKSSGSPPLTNADAIATFRFWLTNPRVRSISEEPPATRELWLRLASRETSSPKLWMDAYLAAFAISGNLRLVTFDNDFRQFETHGLHLHLLPP